MNDSDNIYHIREKDVGVKDKSKDTTPVEYNNSHIYFNYRQIPFTLYIFLSTS